MLTGGGGGGRGTTIPPVLIPNTADPNDDGVIDGDLWWASTNVTTVVGSGVIGKHFTANHYDYTYVYSWNYITQNGTNLNGIICPDGWRLPTNNELTALLKASGFTGANQSGVTAGRHTNINGTGKNGRWFGPGVATGGSNANLYKYTTDTHLFFPFSGYRHDGLNNALPSTHVGSLAYVWSSTPNGSSNAYNLYLNSSYVYPQYIHSRTYSFQVRCVADRL